MNGTNSNTAGKNVPVVGWRGTPQCVSQNAREEIARDLEINIPASADSDIWSGTTEPADKTLIWWPKDAVTGVRIGKPKTYDPGTNTWVELGQPTPVTLPERRFGADVVAAGVSQAKEVPIAPAMPNGDFFFSLTPTTKVGSGFSAASANMDNFGWELIGMEAGKVTIQFFNVPTGGLGFDWKAEQK